MIYRHEHFPVDLAEYADHKVVHSRENCLREIQSPCEVVNVAPFFSIENSWACSVNMWRVWSWICREKYHWRIINNFHFIFIKILARTILWCTAMYIMISMQGKVFAMIFSHKMFQQCIWHGNYGAIAHTSACENTIFLASVSVTDKNSEICDGIILSWVWSW